MKQRLDEATIALRITKEFWDGAVVNLGFGIPGLCALLMPEERRVVFHSENGILGFGPVLTVTSKTSGMSTLSTPRASTLAGNRACRCLTMPFLLV